MAKEEVKREHHYDADSNYTGYTSNSPHDYYFPRSLPDTPDSDPDLPKGCGIVLGVLLLVGIGTFACHKVKNYMFVPTAHPATRLAKTPRIAT